MARKTQFVAAALVLGLTVPALTLPALAAEGEAHMEHLEWSFSGPFGRFEQEQLQRGYQVYREVCSSCHSMDLMKFYNLGEKHGPFYDAEFPNANDNPFVKAFASQSTINDIDTETGENITRPGITADVFPNPYPNEFAARGGNGGALPPDLSVIIKARHGGPDYVYSLMTGYEPAPAEVAETMPVGMNYNVAFAGNLIAMKAPLQPDQVTYADGTPATVDQMSRDVAAFLAWASDPKQTERKQVGLAVMIFLVLLAGLAYGSYRTVWRNESH